MYRRFGYLASRVILEKQDDLRRLEMELDDCEKRQGKRCPERLTTRTRLEGQKPTPQQKILEKIEKKYLEYCKWPKFYTFDRSGHSSSLCG